MLISCVRETPESIPYGRTVNVEIVPGIGDAASKSRLDGAEDCNISNMLVLLYRSSDGRFDKKYVCDGDDRGIQLLSGVSYDIFVLANVENASGMNPPEYETGLPGLNYVIPSYESVNRLGIPCCGSLNSVSLTANGSVNVILSRLMAKVNVHISHKGLTGKPSNDASLFSNVKLYVRQANAVLSPFSPDGSRACDGDSVLEVSDYDPAMTADGSDFVFYVPENMQGCLLPGNLNPGDKTEPALRQAGADVSVLTYMEYTGHLNANVAGYGGDLVYRFYLGADTVGDFNVERNHVYDLSLELSPEHLFDTHWKISHGSDWNDFRTFRLLGQDGSALEDNAILAVRPSHPALIRLFANSDGSSVNMISSAVCGPYSGKTQGQGPLSLRWTSNVVSSDLPKLTLPAEMSAEGLKLEFDSTEGELKVSWNDELSVVREKEYNLEFCLDPDRESFTRRVRVKVLPDCTLENLPEKMYVAQKVPLKVAGALGTYSIRLVSGEDCVDFATPDGEPCLLGKKEGTATLRLVSSDSLNDSEFSVSIPVEHVYSVLDKQEKYLFMPADGTDYHIPVHLSADRFGRTILDRSEFDMEYLEKYLPVQVSIECQDDLYNLEDFIEFDPYRMTAHVKRLSCGGVQLDTSAMDNWELIRVALRYADGKEINLNMGVKPPFLFDDVLEEPLYANAWYKGTEGNWLHMPIYINFDRSNLSLEYSGKMEPVITTELFDWLYRFTFPYQTQIEHLDEDVGMQYVTFVMTNVISGETIRSGKHFISVEKVTYY